MPSETDQETLLLKEKLRSIEWQIEQQNKAIDTIERKAVMLITLYAVTIAFFFSFEWSAALKSVAMILLIFLTFLIMALGVLAFIGAIALELHPSEKTDNNLIHFLKEVYRAVVALVDLIVRRRPSETADKNSILFLEEGNVNVMMKVLLNNYVKRYNINATALTNKTKCFQISLLGRLIFPSIFIIFLIDFGFKIYNS